MPRVTSRPRSRRRLAASLALLAALLAGSAAPLAAQRTARLDVQLPERPSAEGPRVRALAVLENGRLRDLVRNGFPARLHFRTELWSTGGWLNDLEGSAEWDVVVYYDPLASTYQVVRLVGDRVTLLGRYGDLAQAQVAVERPFVPAIRIPRAGRRYYYVARVEVETLSLTDLDEVNRWLRGELRPAVRGERNPGTALGRGLGRLFVRLVGGERQEMEARSGTFVAR
ncbi:MAG TPA: hypothetical protein VGE02_07450 [Gemmatimonadales bacterium]